MVKKLSMKNFLCISFLRERLKEIIKMLQNSTNSQSKVIVSLMEKWAIDNKLYL